MPKLIKKIKDLPDSVKSAVAFTISSLTLRGIAFIVTPIFTRIMSTDQYGIVTTYNSWQAILEVFAFLGLTSAGVFNVGLNDYRERRNQYISSILVLCNVATMISFIIVVAFTSIFGDGIILPLPLLSIMFVQFLFSPAKIFWVTRQRYEYKYKLATFITINSALFTQIIAVILVKCSTQENAAYAKITGTVLSDLVVIIPFYIYVLIKGRNFFDKQIWKQTLLFAIPLLPHYLAQHVMTSADRIMISHLTSNSDAAIYGVVSALSLIATILWSAVNASLTPFVYENLNNKSYKRIDDVVIPLIGIYGVLCFFVALIAPEILAILAPPEYSYGAYAVPPIVGVSFLNALYNTYASIEFYHKKAGIITTATVVSCIVNIILNYLLIPLYGFVAAAYTTLISNVVLIAFHYYGYRKASNIRIFSDKLIALITCACISLCEGAILLYKFQYIRYLFIAALIILFILFRKTIIQKIKSLKS